MFGRKKTTPEEMKTRLTVRENKLAQHEAKARKKANDARITAKDALKKGDDRAYRSAARRYSLAAQRVDMIGGMNEMAVGMRDVIETQMALGEIVSIGQDLKAMQKELGIDPKKLEDAMTQVQTGMEHVNQASNLITSTMEAVAFEGDGELSEGLRAELLAELETETGETSAVRAAIRKDAGVSSSE